MERHSLLADERAVPPVIGIILMVAIVVVLAAIVSSTVFGLGLFGFGTVPQAQFTVEYTEGGSSPFSDCSNGPAADGVLNITHNGGQSIDVDELTIVGAEAGTNSWANCSSLPAGEEIQNQDSAHIEVSDDDVVRLVWESGTENNSHTMETWNGTADA